MVCNGARMVWDRGGVVSDGAGMVCYRTCMVRDW